MSATSWNDEEEAALMYLSHRAQVLYLRGIRRFMDYSTGIVGDKRHVSLQQMRECLEVKPDRSSIEAEYRPTNHEIRASLAQLERRGLIDRLPKAYKLEHMRFFLPLASIRLREEPQENRKGRAAMGVADVSTTCDIGTAREPQRMNRIPPVSGNNNPVLRAREDVVDNPNEERPPGYAPRDRGEWGEVLCGLGFRQEQMLNVKSLPMLQGWVDQRVTLGEFQQAVEVAHARNNGMPATVNYYGWSVREVVANRGREITGDGNGEGQRGRESGAQRLARMCKGAFEPD